jgi:hypothetical protein
MKYCAPRVNFIIAVMSFSVAFYSYATVFFCLDLTRVPDRQIRDRKAEGN